MRRVATNRLSIALAVAVVAVASGCGNSTSRGVEATPAQASAIEPMPHSPEMVIRAFARCRLRLMLGIKAIVATQLVPERIVDRYDDALEVYVFGSPRTAEAYLKPLALRAALSHHRGALTAENVVAFYDTRMPRARVARLHGSMNVLRKRQGRCSPPA